MVLSLELRLERELELLRELLWSLLQPRKVPASP